jgi:hypothetical protein
MAIIEDSIAAERASMAADSTVAAVEAFAAAGINLQTKK